MKILYTAILGLIVLSGCMSQEDKILNAKLLEVDKLYDNGQYIEARNKCEEILAKDPYNEDAIKSLGNIYQKLYGIAIQKRQIIENNIDDASEWSHIPGDYIIDRNQMKCNWGTKTEP